MNIAAFIDSLQEAVAESVITSTCQARFIRFRQQEHFLKFMELWSEQRQLPNEHVHIKPLSSIHSLACFLSDYTSLALFSPFITLETDNPVTIDANAVRSAAPSATTRSNEKAFSWGIKHVKAPQAWKKTIGQQIKIGVVDTGVDFNHPDLRHTLIHGVNLVYPLRPPVDDNGHGTHIAGIIAASNKYHGMTGVAPGALIAPVKAFDEFGSAFVSDIILAIEWCVQNRMDIINMSFGMKKRNKALLDAVTAAYQSGIIIVASSGNDGKRSTIDYPARYTQTIAVGATSKLRKVAPFSNRSNSIDIFAPGDKITSLWPQNSYHEMSGTSMATSHVSGAIALLLALYPNLSPSQIKTIVKRSIQPLKNYKTQRAIGELDITRMLQIARSSHK
ncbi:S8 family serine peptidase [Paenibacillus yanchengensis]|uniref:S8 family serine peptidase n=1 Tax=Paenibacillus yanchengensis TaxID=2035833 RepID=A0ABW4YPK7_9BACL